MWWQKDSRSLSGSGALQTTLPSGSIKFQHLGLPQSLPELGELLLLPGLPAVCLSFWWDVGRLSALCCIAGSGQHLQQELNLFSPALLPISLSQQQGKAGMGCGLFSVPHHHNICKGVDQHA